MPGVQPAPPREGSRRRRRGPAGFENAVTGSSDSPREEAPSVIARATGCSERASTEAAKARASDSSIPGATPTDSSDMTPVVTVPVLSRSMVSIE